MSKFACENEIWVIEDDESCQFVYSEALEMRYKLRFFSGLTELREALKGLKAGSELPDFVIADLKLRGESFLNFLESENDMTLLGAVPFMVVSSNEDIDVLKFCLNKGALDYLTKPFKKNELIVKLERFFSGEMYVAPVVKKAKATAQQLLIAAAEDYKVRLTPKEMQILMVLDEAQGVPVPRNEVIEKVWDQTVVGSKTLDVHLFNLRKKTREMGIRISYIPPQSLQLSRDGVN